jgi:RNA polymerase sigma-70 factor (ECF subfamily)
MIRDFPGVIGAAKDGDPDAVALLWREYNYRVVGFLHTQSRDAAEDIASETWLTVAEKLRQFDGGESEFRAWLFTVARSRLVDWQRRTQRRPQVSVDPVMLRDRPDPSFDSADAAIEVLGTEEAMALIARLSPDQAAVIMLRVLGCFDVERVAQIVEKRPGTVRMLQLRGLRRLAQLLEADESPEVQKRV